MAGSNSTVQFREAAQSDAPQVRHLVESAFRSIDSRPDWTGNAELASSFRVDIEQVKGDILKSDMVTLVAFYPAPQEATDSNNDGATIVATIQVSKRGLSVGRLSMVAVDEQHQQAGLGSQVLAYAEDYCHRTWGASKFSLNALSNRKALIEWYLRRGYRKTGETSPFPRERFGTLTLPEDLCFIEMDKDLVGET